MLYLAIDGDRIGEFLERLILLEDLEGVRQFSLLVTRAIATIQDYLEESGCEIIFSAGDGILAIVNDELDINQLPLQHGLITFSVGVSSNLREALLALKTAKGLGRNQIIKR
jgi:minimal CRISPR polymerase domain